MEEGFLEMVTKCQGHRLDDQRSSLPAPLKASVNRPSSSLVQVREPEEDLFDVLWQMQNSRIEDQRSSMPTGSSVPHIMPPARWHEAEAEVLSDDEFFEMIFSCQVRIFFVDYLTTTPLLHLLAYQFMNGLSDREELYYQFGLRFMVLGKTAANPPLGHCHSL